MVNLNAIEMKKMTCKDLGGACDLAFEAQTFEEMAQMSQKHGMEMMQQGETAHLEAMNEMRNLMQDPAAMQAWFAAKKSAFEALPDA